jgi:hypothetical protein
MEEIRNAYKVLVGKLEGKKPLGRRRCRWEYNIGMDLRQIGWGGGGVWTGCIWFRMGKNGVLL